MRGLLMRKLIVTPLTAFALGFLLTVAGHSQTCEVHPTKVVIPNYPAVALALKEEGTVTAEATIGRTGEVLSTRIVTGAKWLGKTTALVLEAWEFSESTDLRRLCDVRRTTITFRYTRLPSDTKRSVATLSFFKFPNLVEVKYIEIEVTIDPSTDP